MHNASCNPATVVAIKIVNPRVISADTFVTRVSLFRSSKAISADTKLGAAGTRNEERSN